jgi:hypothetical protein
VSKNEKIRIYRTIILPLVLHGCEAWSLTLREEHRLRVFENRVLRRVFAPKRDEELRDLYSSPSIIRMIESRRMGWAEHVARTRDKVNAYRLLGEARGKEPLGRPKRKWVDNIRMDLGEVGWGGVDWIGVAQDRNRWRVLLKSVMNIQVP